MQERKDPRITTTAEITRNIIDTGTKAIEDDLNFFNTHKAIVPRGLLTKNSYRFIGRLYPDLLKLALLGYKKLSVTTLPDPAHVLAGDYYLANSFLQGAMVPDNAAKGIREQLRRGDSSQQVDAFVRLWQRDRLEEDDRVEQKRMEEEGKKEEVKGTAISLFDSIVDRLEGRTDEPAIILNRVTIGGVKGLIEAKLSYLDRALRTAYGEVDYKTALMTEFLLNLPFVEALVRTDSVNEIDSATRETYVSTIKELQKFCKNFELRSVFQRLDDATKDRPTEKVSPDTRQPSIADFDKTYLHEVYDLAKEILEGDLGMESVHRTLRKTLLRRGKYLHIVGDGKQINPFTPPKVTFEEIAGNISQKEFFRNILQRTAENDPAMEGVKLILLVGKPGVGKSLTINALFNGIPENARVIVAPLLGEGRNISMDAFNFILGWASLHKDLQIFVGIEDIDKVSGARDFILKIDSIDPDSFPGNLHLIISSNEPRRISEAGLRPGRVSEILIYEPLKKKGERIELLKIHSRKLGVNLPDKAIEKIAGMTGGFTPDETVHFIRTLMVEKNMVPTDKDLKRIGKKIRERRKVSARRWPWQSDES